MNNILAHSSVVRVRQTTLHDLAFVLQAEQASDNRDFIGQWTRTQHRLALSNRDTAHLIIESVDDNKLVGYTIVTALHDANRSLNLKRIVIVEKGKGYGRATLQLLKQVAFEQWGAHRFWLDVKEFNQRARHLYAAEGFVEEGTLRECLRVGDNFESLVIMSILRNEYQSL